MLSGLKLLVFLGLAPHGVVHAPVPVQAPVAVVQAPAPVTSIPPGFLQQQGQGEQDVPPGFLQQQAAGTLQPVPAGTVPQYGTVIPPGSPLAGGSSVNEDIPAAPAPAPQTNLECVVSIPGGPTFSPGPAVGGSCAQYASSYPGATITPESETVTNYGG